MRISRGHHFRRLCFPAELGKLVYLSAHSSPTGHAMRDADPFEEELTREELQGMSKNSVFYMLDACSACRWDWDDYVWDWESPNNMGAIYVFDESSPNGSLALGAMGVTGVGGFNKLGYFTDYINNHRNATYGEAYKHWFNKYLIEHILAYHQYAGLNYVLLGDPTLGVKFSPGLITAKCRVDLFITAPDLLSMGKQSNEIPRATYTESDLNGDGSPNGRIIILDLKDYQIEVVAEQDSEPTDTYTLEVSAGGKTITLASNVPIGEIPDQPYIVKPTGTRFSLPPVAVANGHYEGYEGSPITFDGSGSYDPDGTITQYKWDFGDGSTAVDTPAPNHEYGDDGTYTVSLAVIDDDGGVGSDTLTVTVKNVTANVDAGLDANTHEGVKASPVQVHFQTLEQIPGQLPRTMETVQAFNRSH